VLNVGLTGNIAAGKSTVAKLFVDWGATLIDADRIVHRLEEPGTPVFRAIVDRFGPGIVAPDGTLDRAALRARVFDRPAERAALEAIVHPAVADERARELAAAEARGDRIVVHDIPLLFETMDPAAFDAVVLVDAPVPIRRARIVATRGLGEEAADRMIAGQLPAEAKRARSTFVIDNAGDRATLERRSREVWDALVARSDAAR
jgi:dephospho-CoA kinase